MLWYVALGSAIGGASRFIIGSALQERFGSGFPVGTLVINVTGSLLLGFLLRSVTHESGVSPEIGAMLTTGVCGGYTTFSTYSYETAALMEDGHYGRAAAYVLLSVGLGLVGVFAGFALARGLLPGREPM